MTEPKNLLQPGWRETRKTTGGLSLHVVGAGRTGDPLPVLPHGFPEFQWAWRHQITSLAEAGLALRDDGLLEIVEGTTHWLHLERPDAVDRRIIAFMADGRRGDRSAIRIEGSDMTKTPA